LAGCANHPGNGDHIEALRRWFNHQFDRFREGYRDLLSLGLRNPGKLVTLVLGFAAVSSFLYPFLGQNFFPSVDTGQFEMHVRMRAGTRIEETARTVGQIEQKIRQIIPASQLEMIVDNMGIPYSGIRMEHNVSRGHAGVARKVGEFMKLIRKL
jgi:multidrug efflux pump subunit AcrB